MTETYVTLSGFRRTLASLASDFMWATSAQAVNLITMLITLKVWATYLVPAELGLMGLIVGGPSILVGLAISPYTQAIFVRFAFESGGDRKHIFRAVAGKMVAHCAAAIIVLLILAGTPIALSLDLHWAIPLAVAAIFAMETRRHFEEAFFASARRQREVAIVAVADPIFRLAFVWAFLHWSEPTAHAAIAGNLIGAAACLLVLRYSLCLEAFPGAKRIPDADQCEIREGLHRVALPLMPSSALGNIMAMGNRYIIGGTVSLQAAGIFVISQGLVTRPFGMLNHVTAITMTPFLSKASAVGDGEATRTTRQLWLALAASGSILGAVLFYLLREPLIVIFLSREYVAAADLIFGLAVASAFQNVSNVVNSFLTIMGETVSVLKSNAIGCVVTLSLTAALCPTIGLPGAVWGLIFGYLAQLLFSTLSFRS